MEYAIVAVVARIGERVGIRPTRRYVTGVEVAIYAGDRVIGQRLADPGHRVVHAYDDHDVRRGVVPGDGGLEDVDDTRVAMLRRRSRGREDGRPGDGEVTAEDQQHAQGYDWDELPGRAAKFQHVLSYSRYVK